MRGKRDINEVVTTSPPRFKLGKLISRLNHPVVISYDGEGLTIPPRGIIEQVDRNKVGALPTGISFSD